MASSFQRPHRQRTIKPRVVIACEGKKTEHCYFTDINRIERLTSVEVVLLPHEGTDPRTVVGQVAEFIKREKRGQSWTKEDRAWAVFDGDEHRQDAQQLQNWHAAIDQADALKIGLAVSNPSFEFWYLLHFREHFNYLTRDQAKQLLKDYLPRYEKPDRLYPVLQPLTTEAIQRAEWLELQAQRNGIDRHENPCCGGVARLVKSLLDLKQF